MMKFGSKKHFGRRNARQALRGFTLIEAMVVIAIVGVLLALAAPSMREMIQMRRLRAVKDQLVTDLQYSRSEAVSRRAHARIDFNSTATLTCYTLYISSAGDKRCDCAGAATGATCDPDTKEIRTVRIPKSLSSQIVITEPFQDWAVGFEPAMGSLVRLPVDTDPLPTNSFKIDVKIDPARTFRVILSRTGRPTVCRPAGSTVDAGDCP